MKDKTISLRLNHKLYAELSLKADATNKSISEYLRESISMSEVKVSNKRNTVAMISAINKMGNNINQIAHNMNIARNAECLEEYDYVHLLNTLHHINRQLNHLLDEV